MIRTINIGFAALGPRSAGTTIWRIARVGAEQQDDNAEPADAELVRAAAAGREDAFEQLIRRHYQTVLNAAWRYTRNREDALDIAQDTFLKAHEAIGHFRDSGRDQGFRAWLVRIAANKALDLLRRKKRRPELPMEAEPYGEFTPTDEAPQRRAALNELDTAIRNCMNRLSPEHRVTLMLREIDGLSYSEIAEATGVPLGTVMSRLFKARQQMRQWLQEAGVWNAPPGRD